MLCKEQSSPSPKLECSPWRISHVLFQIIATEHSSPSGQWRSSSIHGLMPITPSYGQHGPIILELFQVINEAETEYERLNKMMARGSSVYWQEFKSKPNKCLK